MVQDYTTYLSPFTWRYGSPEMRRIWSEAHKRWLWRWLWVQLAVVQSEFGLVSAEQVADLQAHLDEVNVARALEIEAEIHHDLMAELKTFAEQAPLGGRILHLGATSVDIEDNAEVLRMRQALDLVLQGLRELMGLLVERIEAEADTPLIAFTHLQPAEPSTLGYRLASYAQVLLLDYEALQSIRAGLRGKGFKVAVGTGAAYAELFATPQPQGTRSDSPQAVAEPEPKAGASALESFEQRLSEKLELAFFPIATQVYPRKQDYQLLSALAGLGGSLYKFAFDLRLLQSPPVGEWSEPFGTKQVGSSAMPFKRNPINAEKIDSLARALAQAPRLAWDNAAHSLLERTLDDSANRRSLLPESFLACDELLCTAVRLVKGLQINRAAMAHNLDTYGPFAAIERVLMALVKAGADRQEMHEHLRQHALTAWEAVQAGQDNPLTRQIASDNTLLHYLPATELQRLMDASGHIGNAPQRARGLAGQIRRQVLE